MNKTTEQSIEKGADLLVAANSLLREQMKEAGIASLSSIIKGIRERKKWIQIRQEQIEELEVLRDKLFAAYENLDDEAYNYIEKEIREVLNRGCSKKRTDNDDPFVD